VGNPPTAWKGYPVVAEDSVQADKRLGEKLWASLKEARA